jgi:hypothetical protein
VIAVPETCTSACVPVSSTRSSRVARNSSVRVCALTLLLFVVGAANAQSDSSSPVQPTVHGIVINSVTHEPVARALVYSPDHRFGTLTDDGGRFELSVPQPAIEETGTNEASSVSKGQFVYSGSTFFPYMLGARKPGFLGLDEHSGGRNEVQVIPGKEVIIPLVPEARIIGRVALPSANAPDRVEVKLYRRWVREGRGRWTYASSVVARDNGDFRFTDLEPGTYKLLTGEIPDRDPLTADPRGQDYGYPPVYFPNASDFQSASSIQLTPGITVQADLTPVRQPYYPVKIPVTNAVDQPLEVKVYVHGHKGPGFELGYSARDRAIEGELPSGTYVVAASTQDSPGVAGSSNLAVKDGALTTSPMNLVPKSTVRINPKLEFKQAEQPASVGVFDVHTALAEGVRFNQLVNAWLEPADEFSDESIPSPRPPSGSEDNAIVFDGVAPGRYWLRVGGTEGFVASASIGDVDLLHKPLTVGLGSNLVIDVVLRDSGAELSGSVEELASNADPGVSLSARSDSDRPFVYCVPLPGSSGQFRQVPVMPGGKFMFRQIPPGSYRVLAFAHPQELEFRTNEAAQSMTSGTIVQLSSGQKQNVTVHLSADTE